MYNIRNEARFRATRARFAGRVSNVFSISPKWFPRVSQLGSGWFLNVQHAACAS